MPSGHPSEAVVRDYSIVDDLHPTPSGTTVSHGPYSAKTLSDGWRLDLPSRRYPAEGALTAGVQVRVRHGEAVRSTTEFRGWSG